MRIRKVLLLYKKSVYKNYFLNRKSLFYKNCCLLSAAYVKKFRDVHDRHYRTLESIDHILQSLRLPYKRVLRGRDVDYSQFDFVITVGGDGTFLEAAKHVTKQVMLGVNSDPCSSVGKFCFANMANARKVMEAVLQDQFEPLPIRRLRLRIEKLKLSLNVLNDILICHKNPAAMSRYHLRIGRLSEEHRSSGIWIASAAGSSGATHSSGGKILPLTDKRFVYMPRELYKRRHERHKLRGGVLSADKEITITSYMRQGAVFADGAHEQYPFILGEKVTVAASKQPLKIIIKK